MIVWGYRSYIVTLASMFILASTLAGAQPQWSAWESQGGVLSSAPVAVAWDVNRLDVFAKGANGTLIHKWWDGRAWSAWERHDGIITSINRTLYAREVARRSDGSARVADSIFTATGSTISPAQMMYPTPNTNDVDVSYPFQWTQGGLAQAYQLQIFSHETSAIVRDSQEIHIPRY